MREDSAEGTARQLRWLKHPSFLTLQDTPDCPKAGATLQRERRAWNFVVRGVGFEFGVVG